MVAYARHSARTTPFLGEVRQRMLISLLAAILALIDLNLMSYAPPSAARGSYSTVIGVGGTRVKLDCEGSGPATVVLVGQFGLNTAIDEVVRDDIGRAARLCSVSVLEATSRSAPDLARMLPAALYSVRAPAPYVIVFDAQQFPSPGEPSEGIPFDHLVAGWVPIHPMPPPATGAVIRSDGAVRPLPVGDQKQITLAILSLFWPPDETVPERSGERRAALPSSPR